MRESTEQISMWSSRSIPFWTLVVVLGTLLFASSVPSPLYVVYQQEWHFSAITLTAVFAVYALALLGALLVVGSISDHVGRRPTLVAALAVEIVAMLAFAGADGVGWLFVAWTLQGLATGTAMGALSAALLDLQPHSRTRLGALMGAVAPLAGLALGALAAGLLLDYGPDPTRLVFWVLLAGVSAVTAVLQRETSARTTARGGLVALIGGVAVALVAVAVESNALFLAGAAIAGLGFGPAFAGVFRLLSGLAPADQRAALISSVLIVSYLSFSLPAIAAGVAVNDLGLRETAEIYGATLIALAALALALSGRLDDQPGAPGQTLSG